MAEQEQNNTNREQEQSQNPAQQHAQGSVTVPANPEKIRRIVAQKRKETAERGKNAPRHPDVKEEKNAARAGGDPSEAGNERIINPKNNSSNQYR